MHTYNPHEGEPRDYNNPQILHHRVQQDLLLQARFENMHNKYFQNLTVQRKINDSSNDVTRCHDEAIIGTKIMQLEFQSISTNLMHNTIYK
jgi:hypothetical protein